MPVRSGSQMELFGEGAARPAPATDRLFFALQPDPATAAAMAAFAGRVRAQQGLGRLLPPERLHVTLCFLGAFVGVPRQLVDRACEAAAALIAAPFDVCFDRVASFAGADSRRPVVLLGGDSLAPLHDFRGRLRKALLHARVPDASGLAFTPHVTLLYGDRMVSEQGVQPFRWTVRDFVLVRSLIGRGQHQILARFPLAA